MGALPFPLSMEATAWIAEKLQMGEKEREAVGLIPALFLCFSYQDTDEQGRVIEQYLKPFYDIGWYPSETAVDQGLMEFEVLGLKLFLFPETLQSLEGNQLTLDTVEVGFPRPADKTVQLLRADPMGDRD